MIFAVHVAFYPFNNMLYYATDIVTHTKSGSWLALADPSEVAEMVQNWILTKKGMRFLANADPRIHVSTKISHLFRRHLKAPVPSHHKHNVKGRDMER